MNLWRLSQIMRTCFRNELNESLCLNRAKDGHELKLHMTFEGGWANKEMNRLVWLGKCSAAETREYDEV